MKFSNILAVLLVGCIALVAMPVADAANKRTIDRRIKAALEEFSEVVRNADEVLAKAKGVLIFPAVKKAGFFVGGEGGHGALLIDGAAVQYYSTFSASIGFQWGVQVRRQMIVFFDQDTLDDFRASDNWEIGADASVALVTLDAGGEIDTQTFDSPAVAFVYGSKGLMYNLTLEGTKVSKLDVD